MSQMGRFKEGTGPGLPVETITGNSGGAVGPDGSNNIDLLGTGTITVVGNPGTNTLTITPTGAASFTWSVETLDQAMVVNHGYIANKAGTLALQLPAASAVGDVIEVTGINTALGWSITQGAGQTIYFGTSATTTGAGGSLTSTATRDSIRMVCVVANLNWNVLSSVGNITVV